MGKFIGARIVPKHCGVWDETAEYEVLSIVLEEGTGDSYISRKAVPAGTGLQQTDYWAICSRFSEQMQIFSDDVDVDVKAMHKDVEDTKFAMSKELADTKESMSKELSDTKSAMSGELAGTEARVTEEVNTAVKAMQDTEAAMNEAVDQMTARLDANVSASTDTDADYAAEVVDARVDEEGTVHASAGTAMRSMAERISERIDGVASKVADDLASAVNNGCYIQNNSGENTTAGELVKYVLSETTDFIEITKGTIYVVTCRVFASACAVAFYDGEKEFLSCYGNEDGSFSSSDPFELDQTDITDVIPSSAKYMRVCSAWTESALWGFGRTEARAAGALKKDILTQATKLHGLQGELEKVQTAVEVNREEISEIREELSENFRIGKIVDIQPSRTTVDRVTYGFVPKEKVYIKTLTPYFYQSGDTAGTFTWQIKETEDGSAIYGNTPVKLKEITEVKTQNVGESILLDRYLTPNQVLYVHGNEHSVLGFRSGAVQYFYCLQSNTNVVDNSELSAVVEFGIPISKAVEQVQRDVTEVEERMEVLEEKIKDTASLVQTVPNVLYGKVLSVTGDSEAAGHSVGKNGSYGNLIAERNGMVIHNLAINGRKLCTGYETSLCNTFHEIPAESDYILVQIGYNDSIDLSVDNESMDKTTYQGAFNTLIKGLQASYPSAHIGVIEPFYFNGQAAKINAAKWIGKRCKQLHIQCIDGTAASGLRYEEEAQNKLFFLDAVHLTAEGHRRMSYIYENFLRGI